MVTVRVEYRGVHRYTRTFTEDKALRFGAIAERYGCTVILEIH
jgi:hypothetical protein